MTNQVYLFNPNTFQIRSDSKSIVPRDLALEVFSFLKRGSLFNVMLTCRGWLNLAQDSRLWQKEFAVLRLKNVPSYPVLSIKVLQLQERAKKAEDLLQRRVKTAGEFDIAAYSLLYDKQMEQTARQKAFDALQEEAGEKLDLSQAIGLPALLKLYKLGLTPLNTLEKIAIVLREKYGTEKGWYCIADLHIEQNKEAEALNIIDSQLEKNHDISRLIERIVANYCRAKKLNEAIALVKRFSKDPHANLDEARNTILTYAEDAKDLVAIEQAIDEIVAEDWKSFKILNLIDAYLESSQIEKAQVLAIKYSTFIAGAKRYELHHVITMYVRLNQIENAWNLAMKHKDSDDLVFYVLKDAFRRCNLKDELEKVIKMLPQES